MSLVQLKGGSMKTDRETNKLSSRVVFQTGPSRAPVHTVAARAMGQVNVTHLHRHYWWRVLPLLEGDAAGVDVRRAIAQVMRTR